AAGGTGLAAGLGASQDGAELSGAARNPPVGARRLAHRHRAGAWRRVCAAAPGHGHAAALGCRQRGATDAGRAGAEHGVGAAPDPTP
ncbi:cation:proton antiporter, partial [Acinetobacter baumannii]